MIEIYTRPRGSADRRGLRGGSAAVAGSILVHVLLVLGAVRLYRPEQRAAPRPVQSEAVVYVDLPPLPAIATAPPVAAAAPSRSGSSPASSPRADPISRAAETAPSTVPAPPNDPAPAAPEAAPAPRGAASPGGSLDPRLYIDVRTLPPTPEAVGRRVGREIGEAAERAEARNQITVGGRRVTAFRDSATYTGRGARLELGGKWVTMPGDGREWRDMELGKQASAATRDSLLRARARAVRERADARRGAP